ncbi:hypothetical protein ACFWSF_28535 [Streptomyces sp. NPDC058611]|uniref:hypothetical protein n=1 Tax=unclassified Streptomyces TaxID=2593676 RepID=UPI00364FD9E9
MTLTCAVPTAYIRTDHCSAVHVASETARASAQECGSTGARPDRAGVIASERAAEYSGIGNVRMIRHRRSRDDATVLTARPQQVTS